MPRLDHVLQGGLAPPRADLPIPQAARRHVLVVGAGGPLGSLVLERLLASRAQARVVALVVRPMEVALQGLLAWPVAWGPSAAEPPTHHGVISQTQSQGLIQSEARSQSLATPPALPTGTETAVLVFDRDGSRHGREAAFLRPEPHQLPGLAAWLLAAGVQRLVLVLPHAPGLLPPALRAGLANVDEQAVAALGFAQLVLVRPARSPGATGGQGLSWPARLARGLLGQLSWLVPQREQPLRAAKVAELVAALVRGLPDSGTGTRVITPEMLFDWAQPGGGQPWLEAWLQRQPLPNVALPARRW